MKLYDMNDQELLSAFYAACEEVVAAKGNHGGAQMKAAAEEIHIRMNEGSGGAYSSLAATKKHSDLLYAGLTSSAWFIKLGVYGDIPGELNNAQSLMMAETVIGLKEQFNSSMAAQGLDRQQGTKAYVSGAFDFFKGVILP
ncbi:MAG TPA: hypothetical protein VIG74_01980, partial [Alphaproteobacteria bacterium]